MTQTEARRIAHGVLAWLAGEPDILGVFLGATGVAAEELRGLAADPDFLIGLLDFVLMDDAWVLAAADDLGCPPEALGRARQALPGGADVHWT